jgi:hypothetical protein
VRGVQQEDGARRGELEHLVPIEEAELMACDEVGAADEVGGSNRAGAEAEVRDRHRAGFLRVVDVIALRVVLGLLADDLDRVLVRADGPVGAEPEEDGAGTLLGIDVEVPRRP